MTPLKFNTKNISAHAIETKKQVNATLRPLRQIVILIGTLPFILGLIAAVVVRSRLHIEQFVIFGGILVIALLFLFIKKVPTSCQRAAQVINNSQLKAKVTQNKTQKFGFRALISLEKDLHFSAFGKPVFGLNSYTRSIIPVYFISIAFTGAVLSSCILGNVSYVGLTLVATVFNLFFTIVCDSALVRISSLLVFSASSSNPKNPPTNYPRELSALVSMPELNLEAVTPPPSHAISNDKAPNQ